MNKKTIIWTAVLVIILLVTVIIVSREATAPTAEEEAAEERPEEISERSGEAEPEPETVNDDAVEEDQSPVVVDSPEYFEVPDQSAGDSVTITELEITDSRWVVIHDQVDGEAGHILGARLFPPEAVEGEVLLLRPTEPATDYLAKLYQVAERNEEQGRVFDRGRDVPLIDEDGEMLAVEFSTLPADNDESEEAGE